MALVFKLVLVVRLPKSDSVSLYELSSRRMFSANDSMLEANLVTWKLTSLVVSRDCGFRLIRWVVVALRKALQQNVVFSDSAIVGWLLKL